MKKRFLYITAACLALVSCLKDKPYMTELSFPNIPVVPAKNTSGNEVTLHATLEGDDANTKTTYTEDLEHNAVTVGWQAGDQIKVLYSAGAADGSDYTIKTFTTSAGDGTFTGTPGTTEGGLYAHVAYYPLASYGGVYKGDGKESTYFVFPDAISGNGADLIPMMVHTPNADFTLDPVYRFKHTGAVLRFKFTNIPSTARKLVITSADHELAGRFYSTYDSTNKLYYYTEGTPDDNGEGGVNAKYSVTYTFDGPDGSGNYTFYLPYGVATPSGNFTFTFKNSSDVDIITRTTTLGSLASTSLVRNTMYRINMNCMSFDGYPLSSLTIEPSDMPADRYKSKDTPYSFKKTVSTVDYYFSALQVKKESPGFLIKFYGSGDLGGGDGPAKIYNTTSLGQIARIVITKGEATSYYRDNYKVYAGTSSNPMTTEITYSSYVGSGGSQVSTTYNLATGNYNYFTLTLPGAYNDGMGSITIYFKPAD